MAKRCEICGKGPMTGGQVSHSHRVTKRKFNPNIRKVRVLVNGSPKKINICTKCLKSGKVIRAI